MNQTIPTTFNPETNFAVALAEASFAPNRAAEGGVPLRFVLPPEDDFNQRGIPESALHD